MSIAVAASSHGSALAPEPIRVMVVDDAVVVRGIIMRWVEAEPDMQIVASLRGGREALEQVERRNPDVVILDVAMPDMDGITALPLLFEKKRDLVVLIGLDIDPPQCRDQPARAVARRRRLHPQARKQSRVHHLDLVPPRADRQDSRARLAPQAWPFRAAHRTGAGRRADHRSRRR